MDQLISVGKIIDQSWHHYRRHFSDLIGLSSWILILAVLSAVGYGLFPSASAIMNAKELNAAETAGVVISFLTNFIIAPVLAFWLSASLIKMIYAQAKEKKTNPKIAAVEGKKAFWSYVWVNLIYSLIVVTPLLLIIIPVAILSFMPEANRLAMFIGAGAVVLLFVSTFLALRWGVRYYFMGYAMLVDNQYGLNAAKKSRSIVEGRFFAIFWRIVMVKILFALVFFSAMLITTQITDSFLSGFAGINMDLAVRIATILESVLVIVLSVFANPIILIADYLIYESGTGNRT